MKCLVTGAAGFIGSHLCHALLRAGHEVIGLDAFDPSYAEVVKQRNVLGLLSVPRCRFFRLDLCEDRLDGVLRDAEVIFHLAGTPALTRGWGNAAAYWTTNVEATRKLIEAARQSAGRLQRFLLASSAAVYGQVACGDEMRPTRPGSAYGLTKLAAENLCQAYAADHNLPLTILRYFSVYGPRQRPDMAFYRFIRAVLEHQPVTVYGDGQQTRGYTYIDDCVEATIAAVATPPGETYNVGGAEPATVWDVLRRLEALAGRPVQVRREEAHPGEVRHTLADTTRLHQQVGWRPRITVDTGLARQWAWQAGESKRYGEPRIQQVSRAGGGVEEPTINP
jgi:nucleoside-diphosphate-sugar epimerase